MRCAAALSVAAFAALALATPADAALRFERCDNLFWCARLSVPLDRTGSVPGRVPLFVKALRSRRWPARGVTVFLAGGPGQSATEAIEGKLRLLAPAFRTRDLIIFDQRGTGRSGFLRCEPEFDPRAQGAACAAALGPRRAFYTTRDSVEDIETIRRELGVERIALYGTSYGTKVALGYALAYPARVERLLLDSVVEADSPDPFGLDTFAAIPRMLRALCSSGCGPVTRDPVGDLARLVRRLARRPLRGRVIDEDGVAIGWRLDGGDLLDLLLAGDLIPTLRAAIPSAVRAALRGDTAPLLRLDWRLLLAATASGESPRAESDGVFIATRCEESRLPWPRTAPFAERPQDARSAAALVPDAAFWPFDRATVRPWNTILALCERWPAAPAFPALGPGPLPDVPVLLLEGEEDLRTPVETALRVAALFPRSRLLVAPATGHSVLTKSECARRAVGRFFSGGSLPQRCPRVARVLAPLPPRSLREVSAIHGLPGRRGRAVRAVALTLDDVSYFLLGRRAPQSSEHGGLRGGSYRITRARTLVLRRLEYVPGVRVSGSIRLCCERRRRGRLRIAGRGTPDGTLLIRGRRFEGRLGGRRVGGRLPRPAAGSALAGYPAAFAAGELGRTSDHRRGARARVELRRPPHVRRGRGVRLLGRPRPRALRR